MKTSKSNIVESSLKALCVVLFIAAVVFSYQWYTAWLELEEVREHITLD